VYDLALSRIECDVFIEAIDIKHIFTIFGARWWEKFVFLNLLAAPTI